MSPSFERTQISPPFAATTLDAPEGGAPKDTQSSAETEELSVQPLLKAAKNVNQMNRRDQKRIGFDRFENVIISYTIRRQALKRANGVRYLRVGGTRERCFDGTNFQPRKLLENAVTPTRRVHTVLGCNSLPRIVS